MLKNQINMCNIYSRILCKMCLLCLLCSMWLTLESSLWAEVSTGTRILVLVLVTCISTAMMALPQCCFLKEPWSPLLEHQRGSHIVRLVGKQMAGYQHHLIWNIYVCTFAKASLTHSNEFRMQGCFTMLNTQIELGKGHGKCDNALKPQINQMKLLNVFWVP